MTTDQPGKETSAMRYMITAQRSSAHSKVTIPANDRACAGDKIWYMGHEMTVTDCRPAHSTTSPYTRAYTENLVAGMERTRQELKDMINILMDGTGPNDKIHVVNQMHRMVGSITDDLQS